MGRQPARAAATPTAVVASKTRIASIAFIVLGILRIVVTSHRLFTLAHCVALRFGIAFLGRSSERSAVRIVKVLDTDPQAQRKAGLGRCAVMWGMTSGALTSLGYPIIEHTLDNGLRVISSPDHIAPSVA